MEHEPMNPIVRKLMCPPAAPRPRTHVVVVFESPR